MNISSGIPKFIILAAVFAAGFVLFRIHDLTGGMFAVIGVVMCIVAITGPHDGSVRKEHIVFPYLGIDPTRFLTQNEHLISRIGISMILGPIFSMLLITI